MSVKLLGACILLVPALAAAAPSRVLVADDDPELLHAIESSLAPWHLAVVSDPSADDDPGRIAERAASADAQFVVWRVGGELVVFDRERGTQERRTARGGRLDPVAAAAAALTVKTLMRLPAPPSSSSVAAPRPSVRPPRVAAVAAPAARAETVVASPAIPARWYVRAHVGGGGHATGHATEAMGQAGLMLRPPSWPVRVGVMAHATTDDSLSAAGFKGSWSERGAAAVVSWSWEPPSIATLSLEPWAAVGAMRGSLAGMESSRARSDVTWHPTAAVGTTAWWVPGPLRIGATVGLAARGGTSDYLKDTPGMGDPLLLARQPYALTVGIVVGAELGL